MTNDAMATDLADTARAAAAGEKAAARTILEAVQDDVYGLSLRMLGHPADAEDAAQEILLVVLTHLGSFRGESSFRTWVWRIAANHLFRARRGRRETVTFDILDEKLRLGLREEPSNLPDPEAEALTKELRLHCTEAMLLSLDRELRIAYVLGDILNLSSEEGAQVLEIEPAAYRKRLSRARLRLYEFVRGRCGIYDEANSCRCGKQLACAIEQGFVAREDLCMSTQRTRPTEKAIGRAADEVTELMRVAEVMRGPGHCLAPAGLIESLRGLIDSQRLELLGP
jgi:RNA polymerase sigma factor (sigma-70 family)